MKIIKFDPFTMRPTLYSFSLYFYILNIENSSIIILWASISIEYDHAYKSSYKFVSILINKYVNLHINLII